MYLPASDFDDCLPMLYRDPDGACRNLFKNGHRSNLMVEVKKQNDNYNFCLARFEFMMQHFVLNRIKSIDKLDSWEIFLLNFLATIFVIPFL